MIVKSCYLMVFYGAVYFVSRYRSCPAIHYIFLGSTFWVQLRRFGFPKKDAAAISAMDLRKIIQSNGFTFSKNYLNKIRCFTWWLGLIKDDVCLPITQLINMIYYLPEVAFFYPRKRRRRTY